MPDPEPMDLAELVSEHRKRYHLTTSRGLVVLRHIRRLDAQSTYNKLRRSNPGYVKLTERAEYLDAIAKQQGSLVDGKLTPEQIAERERLNDELEPYAWYYFLPCFETPAVKTVEELHAIAGALPTNEWVGLHNALTVLSQTGLYGDALDLELLATFKDRLPPDLTIETVTLTQSIALREVNRSETDKITALLGGKNAGP